MVQLGIKFIEPSDWNKLLERIANLEASSSTVDFTNIDSDVLPSTPNTYDIGQVGKEWKNGVFSGYISLHGTGYFDKQSDNATDWAYVTHKSGESQGRLAIRTDGLIEWGDGTNTRDVNLYRGGADLLQTDDSLTVGGSISSQTLFISTSGYDIRSHEDDIYKAFHATSANGELILALQDGVGRVLLYWNSTPLGADTANHYIVGGEPAGRILFSPNADPFFTIAWAEGGTAGSNITWAGKLKVYQDGSLWTGGSLVLGGSTIKKNDSAGQINLYNVDSTNGAFLEIRGKDHSTLPGVLTLGYGGTSGIGDVRFVHYDGSSWITKAKVTYEGNLWIANNLLIDQDKQINFGSGQGYIFTDGTYMKIGHGSVSPWIKGENVYIYSNVGSGVFLGQFNIKNYVIIPREQSASDTNTLVPSNPLQIQCSYWNGSTSVSTSVFLKSVPTDTSGNLKLSVFGADEATELGYIDNSGNLWIGGNLSIDQDQQIDFGSGQGYIKADGNYLKIGFGSKHVFIQGNPNVFIYGNGTGGAVSLGDWRVKQYINIRRESDASDTNPLVPSNPLAFLYAYWDGANSVTSSLYLKTIPIDTSGNAKFSFLGSDEATELAYIDSFGNMWNAGNVTTNGLIKVSRSSVSSFYDAERTDISQYWSLRIYNGGDLAFNNVTDAYDVVKVRKLGGIDIVTGGLLIGGAEVISSSKVLSNVTASRSIVTDFWDSPFWDNIPDKPFSTLGTEFTVSSGELQINSINFTKITSRVFTNLTDTPSSYSGYAGYVVRVNSTSDGLEFYQIQEETYTVKADSGDTTPDFLTGKVDNSTIRVNTSSHCLEVINSPKWEGYTHSDNQTLGGDITIGNNLYVNGNTIYGSGSVSSIQLGDPTFLLRNTYLNKEGTANSSVVMYGSRKLYFRGSYWNGSSGVDFDAYIYHKMETTTPTSSLQFYINNYRRAYLRSDGYFWIYGSLEVNSNKIYDSGSTERIILGSTITFNGDIKVNGNDIKDSGGTTRITLGNLTAISGDLKVTGNTIYGSDGVAMINWDPSGNITFFDYDVSIGGNLNVMGSLSVGGTKGAIVPSKSGNYTPIPAFALESPFVSGVYVVFQVQTTNGIYTIDLPTEVVESIREPILVFATPHSQAKVWREVDLANNQIRIYSDVDTTIDVLVWARRWDTEVLEDARKQVWYQENFG